MNPTPARTTRARRHRRGFTLTEVLIVIGLIVILTSLLFVAVGAVVRTGRENAERTFMRSIGVALEQFDKQFGALPPLVDDDASGGPVASDYSIKLRGTNLNTQQQKDGPAKFLRYEAQPNEPRWSRFTMPFYQLGVLRKEVDGVEGPGFTAPDRDGAFAAGGREYKPMFDFGASSDRLKREAVGAQPEYRFFIADRWGNPIRLYRWLPTYHEPGNGRALAYPGAAANDPNRKGEIRSYNVPMVVGNPTIEPSLRAARWALVSGGPNGMINDAAAPESDENKDNIVIWEGGQ
ncbi:MAG: type II secretion system protein [Phycisphaerales bacterium]